MKFECIKTDEKVTFSPILEKTISGISFTLDTYTIKRGMWDAIVKAIREELL